MLEPTFERDTTSSSKDVPIPTFKASSISEEDEEKVLLTTIGLPSASNDPKKSLKKKQKKVRNNKPTAPF